MLNLGDIIDALPNERRGAVGARGRQRIAEEQGLRDLRQALRISQQQLAERMGTTQTGISRMEKRSDLLVSSVRDYVEAIGGTLRLVIEVNGRSVDLAFAPATIDAGGRKVPRSRHKAAATSE